MGKWSRRHGSDACWSLGLDNPTGMCGRRAVRGMAAKNGVTEGKFKVAVNCPSKRRASGKGCK